MNRAGDRSGAQYYRADRFFAVSNQWYFATRESEDQGPYRSKPDAEQALASYVRAYKYLGVQSTAPNDLVRRLEQGFAELADLNVTAAWQTLSAAVEEMGVPVELTSDAFSRCDEVLCAAESLYQSEDARLTGLPAHLRDYSHRSSIRPFPLAGMLVPGRLYIKKPTAQEVFGCKVSETGAVTVADTTGKRVEENLAGLPLDARAAVMMLISMMRGIIPKAPLKH